MSQPRSRFLAVIFAALALSAAGPAVVDAIQCYVQEGGSQVAFQSCPPFSVGCIKQVHYRVTGQEVVTRLCGMEESPDFEYNEGCDSISVPYREQKCYCRAPLCNTAADGRTDGKALLPIAVTLLPTIAAFVIL